MSIHFLYLADKLIKLQEEGQRHDEHKDMLDVTTYVQVIKPPLRRTVQVLSTLCLYWSVRSTATHTNTDTHLNFLSSL